MSLDLQSPFKNNINQIAIRSSGSSLQIVTDRAVDIDNNGVKEKVTVVNGTALSNTPQGNKMKPPSQPNDNPVYYETLGTAHSILNKTAEPDGGRPPKGQTFTIDD